MTKFLPVLSLLIVTLLSSCGPEVLCDAPESCEYARYFDILPEDRGVVVISPYDGRRDTLLVEEAMDNIVCMSSSHVAALSEIGADSLISAVSGIGYISNKALRERYASSPRNLHDIGYEASLDYERILQIKPDILVTYTVTGSEPMFLSKLRSLKVPVMVLHDHLECHPLAKAEYVRLFGVLTGRSSQADSVFAGVRDRYEAHVKKIEATHMSGSSKQNVRRNVIMNVPYGDAWYVPGGAGYMARLVKDAGGQILGAAPGSAGSRVISMEEAYLLSDQADIWLNPGNCSTLRQLESIHQLFPSFGPLKKGLPVYNNTLRMTPEGGNDFWESGSMRPDLILEDLVNLMAGKDTLNYFFRLD